MGSLNCSCAKNETDKKNQFSFEVLDNKNQEELLKNMKKQFEEVFQDIEPINEIEFDENLEGFPNIKEIFEEYKPKIMEKTQQNNSNRLTPLEPQEREELFELASPIKLCEDEKNFDLFQGFVNNNYQLSGKGCYISKNFLYYGFFQNNEYNGKGIMINKDGSYLFGDWINGECTGKGILKIIDVCEYQGDFVKNQKHGFGIEKYPEGSYYEGEFKNNKKNGKGKYIISISSGESYVGEFKDDLFDGEGTFKWPSESRQYTGQFKNGNMNGKGINKYKDGSIYEGYYKEGLKHGAGKYTWPNGKIFYGNWLNNKLHGNGYYEIDNEKYSITFRFGKIISTKRAEESEDNTRIRFSYDNIVNKDNLKDGEKYICFACNNLLYEPHKCCGCFKNYCIDCIKDEKENKKCKNCGENDYEINLDLLHDLIANIKIYCETCKTEIDYKSSLNHYHS